MTKKKEGPTPAELRMAQADYRKVEFTSGGTLVHEELRDGMMAARLAEGPVRVDGWHDDRFCESCGHHSECTWSWGEVLEVVRGKASHYYDGACPKCKGTVTYACMPTGPHMAIAVAQGWGGRSVLAIAQWLHDEYERFNRDKYHNEGSPMPRPWDCWPEMANPAAKAQVDKTIEDRIAKGNCGTLTKKGKREL